MVASLPLNFVLALEKNDVIVAIVSAVGDRTVRNGDKYTKPGGTDYVGLLKRPLRGQS